MKRYLGLYFILVCIISACGSTPTKVALQPSATAPASTRTPTAATTQQPTLAATLTKTPGPTTTATATPVIRTIEGQFDLFQALNLMYRPPAVVRKGTWGFVVEIPWNDLTAKAFVNLVVSYQEESTDKYLVVTSYAITNCHPCTARIDVATFSRHDGHWQMDLNQEGVTSGGSFGYMAKGDWGAIGPHKHGVLLHSEYGGQGYSGDTTIIIAEVDGTFEEVFRLPTAESHRDVIDESHVYYAHTSQLEFQDSGSAWYNIVVKHKGTDRDQKPLPEKSIYVFSNGKYELVTQP